MMWSERSKHIFVGVSKNRYPRLYYSPIPTRPGPAYLEEERSSLSQKNGQREEEKWIVKNWSWVGDNCLRRRGGMSHFQISPFS